MRPASEYDEPEAQRRNGLSLVVVVVVVAMVKGISLFCLPEPEALLMDCPSSASLGSLRCCWWLC